jgi:DnaJ domain
MAMMVFFRFFFESPLPLNNTKRLVDCRPVLFVCDHTSAATIMILRIRNKAACCILLVSSLFLETRIIPVQAFSLLPTKANSNLHTAASPCSCQLLDTTTRLHAGGMGMAATSATVKNKSKGKVQKNEKAAPKNGMCKKISSTTNGKNKNVAASFDVSASLARLEKRYGELELAAAKQLARQDKEDDTENNEDPRWAATTNSDENDKEEETSNTIIITSEFIVAARASSKVGVDDWVPIAQLLVSRPDNDSMSTSVSRTSSSSSTSMSSSMDLASLAVAAHCRELSHLAALGAPAFFKSVARNGLEYSLESIDSFHKHVYTGVVDGGHAKVMTKAEARRVLGLDEANRGSIANGSSSGSDDNSNTIVNPKAAIKQAYRRLSFDLHPDRFQGETAEENEAAAQRFALVKQAYESLSSGVRGVQGSSWYESLGGKSRTDFCGPVELISLATALDDLNNKHGCETAIAGLDKDLIQSFVARNLRSSE